MNIITDDRILLVDTTKINKLSLKLVDSRVFFINLLSKYGNTEQEKGLLQTISVLDELDYNYSLILEKNINEYMIKLESEFEDISINITKDRFYQCLDKIKEEIREWDEVLKSC